MKKLWSKVMKIIAIFFVSLFFRLLYLGVVPASLAHDETDNIIQAHALVQTGSDIEGKWKPLGFLPNSGIMAELAPFINAPILSIFPNTIFTQRLTTAILSSIFPLLILIWLTGIGVESEVSFVSASLLAISPWHILFSRTALEQPTSLFFYLLSWIFLAQYGKLNISVRQKWINIGLFSTSYAIGFFTYHGYKFALPVLTTVIIVWQYLTVSKKRNIATLILPLLVVGMLILRTFLYSDSYFSRSSELVFFNSSRFESTVNSDRRQSIAPEILKKIYSNKFVKLSQTIRDKYLGAIDPDLLFLHGEANGVFSTWQTGYLYLITLPFLLIGLGYLILTHDKYHLLFLILLLLSPLASVIHVNNTLAFRSGIYFVILNIIVAYGIDITHREVGRFFPKYRNLLNLIIGFLLAISFSSFLYFYFFVTPVTNANAYFFGDRLVANYIQRSPGKKILLIVSQPRYLYSAIQLTKTNITQSDIESFGKLYSPTNLDEYYLEDLAIARGCPKGDNRKYDTIIVSKMLLTDLGKCDGLEQLKVANPKLNISSFVSPQDSGEEFRIFGDQLCAGQELSSYVHPTSLNDFKLESMSLLDFCQKWVVKQ